MTRQCVNCPVAVDHSTADCPVMRASLPVGVPVDRVKALDAAVSAIYFDDGSDFLPALWSVVRNLAPELEEELKDNPSSAWHKVQNMLAAPVAQPAADLSREVEKMVRALEEGEWAEHAGQTELGSRLENAITGLINRVTAAEQSAPGEVEDAEVVAFIDTKTDNKVHLYASAWDLRHELNGHELMTVAQHKSIVAQLHDTLDECDGERWKLRTKVQQLEAFSSQAAGSAVEEPAAWETRCNTERRFSVNQCSAEERAEHWRKNGRGIVEVAPLYYAALSTQQSAPERVSVPRDALQWPLEVGVDAQQKAADVGCDREDCLHDALQAMLAEIASHGRGEA